MLALKDLPIQAIRAGIWKPRTRPDTFEGVGEEGIHWVKEAALEIGKPIVIEVASTKHVEQCLKAGVDMLWVGARTTVNPFIVQDLANAVKGVDIPILIKNPVNPDLDLWIGAIERFQNAGINKIMAVHRGFSSYEKSIYRNKPFWEIPIELKRRFPNLPIICDPSHICGTRSLLSEVSQTAIDLNFDGLMIETHINPDVAWSDAKQQITPADLKILLDNIIIRQTEIDNTNVNAIIAIIRSEIDGIDASLVDVIANRFSQINELGIQKSKNNITIYQPERWDQIVKLWENNAARLGLNQDFIYKILSLIHQESIRIQSNVYQKDSDKNN